MKRIKREDFIKILKAVKPGIATKEILEESSHFVFTGKAVLTFNDQICISYPFETEFQCSVPGEVLYNLVNKLKDEVLMLELDGNSFKVVTKTTQAGIQCTEESQIFDMVKEIKIPGTKSKKWEPLREELLDALKWCMFSASRNATIPYMTCVYAGGKTVMATDELRVSLYSLEKKVPYTLLLPAENIRFMAEFGPQKYSVSESWSYFINQDGVVFSSRVINDEYPADTYKAEFDFTGKTLKLPGRLVEALQVTEILAEGEIKEEKRVDILLKDDVLTVKAKKADVGWVNRRMKIKYKKKPISFTINPLHLMEIMNRTDKMIIGEDRALFTAGEFKHLVSLFTEE